MEHDVGGQPKDYVAVGDYQSNVWMVGGSRRRKAREGGNTTWNAKSINHVGPSLASGTQHNVIFDWSSFPSFLFILFCHWTKS